jgi:hypothetical protein
VANSIEITSVLEDQRMKVSHMKRIGIYNYVYQYSRFDLSFR